MKKYMLILFSYCKLKKINSYLKRKLVQNDQLLVRAIKLEQVPKLSEHLISDVGVLGKKVVHDLEESVVDNYQDKAKEYLAEIKEIAAAENFKLKLKLIDHHNLKNLKKEIKENDIEKIIINFSQNEFASDQAEEEELKLWLQKLDIEQVVFYDGKRK